MLTGNGTCYVSDGKVPDDFKKIVDEVKKNQSLAGKTQITVAPGNWKNNIITINVITKKNMHKSNNRRSDNSFTIIPW